jgi:hypothetical protein
VTLRRARSASLRRVRRARRRHPGGRAGRRTRGNRRRTRQRRRRRRRGDRPLGTGHGAGTMREHAGRRRSGGDHQKPQRRSGSSQAATDPPRPRPATRGRLPRSRHRRNRRPPRPRHRRHGRLLRSRHRRHGRLLRSRDRRHRRHGRLLRSRDRRQRRHGRLLRSRHRRHRHLLGPRRRRRPRRLRRPGRSPCSRRLDLGRLDGRGRDPSRRRAGVVTNGRTGEKKPLRLVEPRQQLTTLGAVVQVSVEARQRPHVDQTIGAGSQQPRHGGAAPAQTNGAGHPAAKVG